MIRSHLPRLLLAALAGAAAELCGLGLTAAAAWLIARAAERPPLSALGFAIVAVRGCAVFKGVFRYAERLAGHDAALRVLAGLRVRVFEALARSAGGLRDAEAVQRMVVEVEAVQDLLLRCALPGASAVAAGIAALGFVTAVHPVAGAALAGGLAVAGLMLPALAWTVTHRSGNRLAQARDDLAVAAVDLLEGADDLTVFGAAGRAARTADAAAARLAALERRSARVSALVTAAGALVQAGTTLGVLLTVRDEGTVTTAVLTLTTLVAVEALLPLSTAAQHLTTALPATRRITALLRTASEAATPTMAPLVGGPVAVELREVRVVRSGGRVALDGVTLRVGRGRRVAIVGASGAGKSTLLEAVAGEASLAGGLVVLAGLPLRCHDPDEVRRAVRGRTGACHVFAATIRANLLLARPGATGAEVEAAARRARFFEVVDALPGRWDADARTLSGGERQRLLLARAFLADPGVLLLDEPFESLDTAMADALTRDLFTAPPGATLLLVTHRLAHLDLADEIIVLDRGRVAQRGTHDALAAVPGPYRDLCEAERFTATPEAGLPVGSGP